MVSADDESSEPQAARVAVSARAIDGCGEAADHHEETFREVTTTLCSIQRGVGVAWSRRVSLWLVAGGDTTIAAVMPMITSPIANSATTALAERADVAVERRRVVEASVDATAIGVGEAEHGGEHDDLGDEVAAVVGVEQVGRVADEAHGLHESGDDEHGDADRGDPREVAARPERARRAAVLGMTIQPTIASPAIHAAAAAWWATSVTTPSVGQRIDREWPANAHVASRPSPGSETAVQYTSGWTISVLEQHHPHRQREHDPDHERHAGVGGGGGVDRTERRPRSRCR